MINKNDIDFNLNGDVRKCEKILLFGGLLLEVNLDHRGKDQRIEKDQRRGEWCPAISLLTHFQVRNESICRD